MISVLVFASLLAGAGESSAGLPFDPDTVVERVTAARRLTAESPFLADTVEFMLDTVPLGYTKVADQVRTPVVCSDGEDYLVVWQNVSNPDAILAVRVSGTGQLLDTTGIVISGPSIYSLGDVAFGDSVYLVAWTQSYYSSLLCARVTRDGRVLDRGFPVASSATGHYRPAVGFADGVFLVAWHDARSRLTWMWDIYCARVNLAGVVLDTPDVHISASSSGAHGPVAPDVASNGRDFFVTWDSERTGFWGIWGARMSGEGSVLDSAFLVTWESYSCKSPSMAFDGTNYLVAWCAGTEAQADICAARVSSSGAVIDRVPIELCTASQSQEMPAVAFDGSNYFVAWQDWRNGNRDIYGTRMSPAGSVLDPDGIPITRRPQDEQEPAVAYGAGNYLVAWLDYRWPNDADVFAARVSTSGSVLDSALPLPDTLPLVPRFAPQILPDAAFDGENYLVVWEDQRTPTNEWDIYGSRVNPGGDVLDSVCFRITGAAAMQGNPAVAFGESTYLVVWEDRRRGDRDIFGARVAPDGRVLDSAGIPIHAGQYEQLSPAVAFDGTGFVVVYDNNGRAYCASVDQAGHVLNCLSLTSSEGAKKKPAVAAADSCLLVPWEDWRYSPHWGKMHATRFVPPAGIIDSTDFLLCTRWGCYAPSVASDGENFVVAWHEEFGRAASAARVSSAGYSLDSSGITLMSEPGRLSDVDIAYMGEDYLLALIRDDVLYRVRTNGALSEVDTLRLSRNPGKDRTPAIARGPACQALVVYPCSTSSQLANGASTFHIWGRFIADSTPMPPAKLWPPNGYDFQGPPVWLLVDTTLVGIDSFGFRVYASDTLWSQTTTSPRCTVPDTLLSPGLYSWQCRIRTRYGWSKYCSPWTFWWGMIGVEEPQSGPAPRASYASATVVSRTSGFVTLARSVVALARAEVIAADGRRVAVVLPERDGVCKWGLAETGGRAAPSGIYVVRLVDRQGVVVHRKLVLVD